MPGTSFTDVGKTADTKRGGDTKPVRKDWKKKKDKSNAFKQGK